MKKQLLKMHYAFIIMMVFSFAVTNAQIVYTDVNPDFVICSPSCGSIRDIDLNNDGIIDFRLQATSYSTLPYGCHGYSCACHNIGASVIIYPYSDSVAVNSSGYPLCMNLNDTIGANLLYSNQVNMPLRQGWGTCNSLTNYSGNWTSVGYLGVKLITGGKAYYGWIHLSVTVYWVSFNAARASCTLMDYAFNSVANQSILAGQTCSPQATIKANGPLSFCSGGSVVLTSQNPGNTLTYQWKKNNVNITGAINKSYIATTAGDYKVKVTDTINNCLRTSGIKTVTVPCRNSNEDLDETKDYLSVFPNPSNEYTVISAQFKAGDELTVTDVLGKTLFRKIVEAPVSSFQLQTSNFARGIYFVRVGNASAKLVKQ